MLALALADRAEVEHQFRRWIKAEPDNAEAWYELGSAEEGLGNNNDALASYRKVVSILPSHSEALFHLGVFASQRGDRDEMHKVSLILAKVDQVLAEEFNKKVGCDKEC